MAMRIDETISGVKADLATKVFGDDCRTLDALGQQAMRSISTVRGAADAQMEVTSGVAELSVQVDRNALARYGLNVSDVEEAVAAGVPGTLSPKV
jgi:cobalt-zinc-cadmium resistance protein CzcA